MADEERRLLERLTQPALEVRAVCPAQPDSRAALHDDVELAMGDGFQM